jgi:protein TonB
MTKSGALAAFEPAVPITLLSTDDHLRQTLRTLLDDQPVFVARTLDELNQLASLGRCSIVITDQALVPGTLAQIKEVLRDCVPASVLIAVGERTDSEWLVRLLSAGTIDRFMVKPLEGRRTRFALRSAALQFRSLRAAESTMESAEAKEEDHTLIRKGPPAIVPRASIATLERRVTRSPTEIVVGDPTLVGRRSSSINPPQPQPPSQLESSPSKAPAAARSLPTFLWPAALVAVLLLVAFLSIGLVSLRTSRIDPRPLVAKDLTAAQASLDAGRLVEPAEQSALHYYAAVLALDPTNGDAQRGIDTLVDRLLSSAKEEVLAGRLAQAESDIANARRLRPSHRQLPYADAELANARERERLLIEAAAPEPVKPVELAKTSPKAAKPTPAKAEVVELPVAAPKTLVQQVEHSPQLVPVPEPAPVTAVAPPVAPQFPARVKYVPAVYPREARQDELEGWVDLSIGVTALGNVVDPRVVGGRRREIFGRAAVDAVRQWKYAPVTEGEAALVRPLTVRVEFRLDP